MDSGISFMDSHTPTEASLSVPPFEAGEFAPMDECERGVIEIFVSAADVLGFPRSLGELYGLAYISPHPIHLAEVCERLKISKGSASQGLRTLRDLGALKPVYVAGDRRDYFQPEIKMRVLVGRLLAERLRPHLERSAGALAQLESEAAGTERDELKKFRQDRIQMLGAWQKRISTFLPLVQRILR
jgi:HTH-type transcriptional regulator, glycine betaine synthesis regulator